jgi:hypothetical protein
VIVEKTRIFPALSTLVLLKKSADNELENTACFCGQWDCLCKIVGCYEDVVGRYTKCI